MTRSTAPFPLTRLRRTRKMDAIRGLVRENAIGVSDLILPVFVREGLDDATPIPSMPGVERLTIDRLVRKAVEAHGLGI
ncbi:MAG: porphobilinogen synthase, partial [Celeribacter marinus]